MYEPTMVGTDAEGKPKSATMGWLPYDAMSSELHDRLVASPRSVDDVAELLERDHRHASVQEIADGAGEEGEIGDHEVVWFAREAFEGGLHGLLECVQFRVRAGPRLDAAQGEQALHRRLAVVAVVRHDRRIHRERIAGVGAERHRGNLLRESVHDLAGDHGGRAVDEDVRREPREPVGDEHAEFFATRHGEEPEDGFVFLDPRLRGILRVRLREVREREHDERRERAVDPGRGARAQRPERGVEVAVAHRLQGGGVRLQDVAVGLDVLDEKRLAEDLLAAANDVFR
jgi:hypothetical protein